MANQPESFVPQPSEIMTQPPPAKTSPERNGVAFAIRSFKSLNLYFLFLR